MKLSVLFFLSSLLGFAQYTAIPDINFENKLIALGIDLGVADGQVLTTKINTITALDVSSSSITNLAGIEGFVSLKTLYCYNNKLTTLDVSKNTALLDFSCDTNQLTTLDVSKNTALTILSCNENKLTSLNIATNTKLNKFYCFSNQLTTLDVSKNIDLNLLSCSQNKLTSLNITTNTKLNKLHCFSNQLTTLDVSKNTALTVLDCYINKLTALDVTKNTSLITFNCEGNELTALDLSKNTSLENFYCPNNKLSNLNVSKNTALIALYCNSNLLSSLNIKNGNNTILTYFDATKNSNLSCIQVDDAAYSNTNWSTQKDATATYNTACSNLGVPETVFEKMSLYPNPTQGELHIDHIVLEKATLYDASGKLLKTTKFTSATQSNTLNMEAFSKGMYYLFLESEGTHTVKKIVVE
ncbi:T9SS type A sorting domain-containing protein [Flavobacterium chungangense]|uniref:Secretion system C-terminal sorting domain-containing protein n=1 Tax=Flavobacterium chungangense TaxID=554283 RepID=A0A6V6YLY5_9FLAO|nr:T9SS type A sorting domain-containing protein [Flavobacterium chungangense]CAD0000396.1 hypothetical protein FLACHUCJ7_00015 [Flavobacterium chungangense]